MLRCPMFFTWFDHPLIEGWREARLEADRCRQHPPSSENGALDRLVIPVIETASRCREVAPRTAGTDTDGPPERQSRCAGTLRR